ncbi:hypothetical protein VTN77DRAFT_4598 [Rasamsonia byssochlamydoides]|uniref:uncharacterized protein n=1 Tax=Rasamsonia byssochlamydoides TaxID=89139 RepID=UPI003741FDB9
MGQYLSWILGSIARSREWLLAYQMADDGSKTASGTCARCQRPTMNRCTGCLEAPVYDKCVPKPTFYCSPVCQKADWGQHKSECRKLQARKALARAALLLQAIIYRIRLHASPLRFKSVRIEGSIIFLEGFQFDGLDTQRHLKPFSVSLDGDRSLFEAVLVHMGCTEAMMYLHSFAQELLAGLCSKIEEVNVSMINPKLRFSLIHLNGHQIDLPNSFHNLYRVTLKNGEIWAVDTTGAQYGYANPLCPWRDFEQYRLGKINRVCEFGYIRHQVYQSYGMFPERHMVAQEIEKQELTRALEEKIPALAREHGGKLNAILKGSDTAFKQAKDRFLDQLEDYLRASMTKLYAPEQMMRRNKEVECQLSQNMADPDRQKRLDGMMRFIASAVGTAP